MTKNFLKIHDSIMKQYAKNFKRTKNFKDYLNKLPRVEKAFVLKHISPQNYYPWDRFATDLLWQLNPQRNSKKTHKDKTKWMVAPAYYLTQELAEAFIRTPVDNLKLEEKPNIINQEFIIFQPNKLNGTNYTLVKFSTFRETSGQESDIEVIAFKSYGRFSKGSTGSSHKCKGHPKTQLSEVFSLDNRVYKWHDRVFKKNYKNYPTEKQEQINIVANMILFMNQKPDITVEEYIPSSVIPLDPQPEKEIVFKPRAITWIGKNFTQRIIKIKTKEEELIIKQKGNPVRSHWRRGHWHTICKGPKRRKRQLKWYQPVFITGRGVI